MDLVERYNLGIFEEMDKRFINIWKGKILTEIKKSKFVFSKYEADVYWHICNLFVETVGFYMKDRDLYKKLSSFFENNPDTTKKKLYRLYNGMWMKEFKIIHSEMNEILENKKDDVGTFKPILSSDYQEKKTMSNPLDMIVTPKTLNSNNPKQIISTIYPKEKFWKDNLPLTITSFRELVKNILKEVEGSIEKGEVESVQESKNIDWVLKNTSYNVSENNNRNIEIRKLLLMLFGGKSKVDYSGQLYEKGNIIHSKVIEIIRIVISKHIKKHNGAFKKIKEGENKISLFSDIVEELEKNEKEWKKETSTRTTEKTTKIKKIER